jgi:Protein of unknown function (DUF3224)
MPHEGIYVTDSHICASVIAMTTTTNAKAEFQIGSWDEQPYTELAGTEKFTRVTAAQTYTGDLAGESRSDSLMYYGPGEVPVHYVGLEHFTCTLDGKSGTFVAQARGVFTDGVAATDWFVVPGSGTGDLVGLRGEGGYRAGGGEPAVTVSFDYFFQA